MANVKFFQPFDLSQPSLGGNILNAVVTRQTSNQVVIDFDDEQISFQGQNITYSGNLNLGGNITGGTIQSFSYSNDSTGNIIVANNFGTTVNAVTVYSFVRLGNVQGLFNYALRGNDTFSGSAGNDVILGYNGNDVVRGFGGNDTLLGQAGNDWIDGGVGADRMDGGVGIDTLDVRFFTSRYVLNMATGTTNIAGETARNFERVYTGRGNDVVNGTARNNLIVGGAGNDKLSGFGGRDTILGQAGNDWIDGGVGADRMDGGDGVDTLDVRFFTGRYVLNMTTGGTNIAGETARNFERVYTGRGNDVVNGTSAGNFIASGAGNDVLRGFDGNDNLFGQAGNDTILGQAGNDRLDGGANNDTLIGGANNDRLVGNIGNDRLIGTDFTAQGRRERDTLISGNRSDRDIFVLAERRGGTGQIYYDDFGTVDFAIIQDFDIAGAAANTDRIQLLGSAANYRLSAVNVSGIQGTGIFASNDLIGIVRNTNVANLRLTNSSQFIYV